MPLNVENDDEFYDYYQEVATSSFGDMLFDDERNKKYSLALKKAINKMHSLGRPANVLDIGTGTGLLSMLAVKHGADSVVACEMFPPVAKCAYLIIRENEFADKIKLVQKHSTLLTVGPGKDLPQRANILVSEVFDTELIGEGAIKTFNHAHEHLLEEGSIVVPSVGNVYGMVVESEMLLRWNRPSNWMDNGKALIRFPSAISDCPGTSSLFDLQLSQLPREEFIALTKPLLFFKFDFMRNRHIPNDELSSVSPTAISSGKAQAVFMWWDLIMDDEDEIVLSCAPVWCHPYRNSINEEGNPAKHIPWRDHWMQAVYFLPKETPVKKDERIKVRAWHDEFSLWFAACSCAEAKCSCEVVEPPACVCGFHLMPCRTRLAALNDPSRQATYIAAAKKLLQTTQYFVVLSDFTFLGLLLSNLGAKKVYLLPKDSSSHSLKWHNLLSKNNESIVHFQNLKQLVDALRNDMRVLNLSCSDFCVLGEPFYQNSLQGFENAFFYKEKEEFFQLTADFLDKKDVKVCPEKIVVKAGCVQFDDLWKISRPVVECEGFRISIFDDMVRKAKEEAQESPEPQPLWEYPCIAAGEPITLLEIPLSTDLRCTENCVKLPRSDAGYQVDGIAVWCEYHLDGENVVQTGPVEDLIVGEYIKWQRWERQGVHLYETPPDRLCSPNCSVLFDTETGNFQFKFGIDTKTAA